MRGAIAIFLVSLPRKDHRQNLHQTRSVATDAAVMGAHIKSITVVFNALHEQKEFIVNKACHDSVIIY